MYLNIAFIPVLYCNIMSVLQHWRQYGHDKLWEEKEKYHIIQNNTIQYNAMESHLGRFDFWAISPCLVNQKSNNI